MRKALLHPLLRNLRNALPGVALLLCAAPATGQSVQLGLTNIVWTEGNTPTFYNIQVTLTSPAPSAGTVNVTATYGPGITYGAIPNDHQTNPPTPVGNIIPVNVAAGANNANFFIFLNDDILPEATETINFSVTGVPAAWAGWTIGPNFQCNVTIYDNDSPTTLLQGDLLIVGVNANNFGCSGITGEDQISFFCFKDITAGTTIDITDNGYERQFAGLWGDTEGRFRATRTGPTIPAGTVITMRLPNTAAYSFVAPDNSWTYSLVSGIVNLNNGGDQLFFMQGGAWSDPPGANNAQYTGGSILYGFSTNSVWLAFQNSSQHSGLPFGIDCFSMAPTVATDFTKYTGPLTATNQRGWIIRVDEPLNWSSYSTCALYNGAAPNWTTAPVLPITTTGFTPGLWTGATSNDWFQCKNWDDARVPISSTNVTINQTATQSCVVNNTATAVCNNLTLSTAGATRNLTLTTGATLNANGNVLVQRTAGTGAVGITLQTNCNLSANSMTLQSLNAGSQEAFYRSENNSSTTLLSGNMTINTGGLLDLSGPAFGSLMLVGGNWTNNSAEADFDDLRSTVEMNGVVLQTLNTSGFNEHFGTLRVNKPLNDVSLLDPVTIRQNLDLVQGRVLNGNVHLLDNATATNASDQSFVHEFVYKYGNDNFVFPVGKGNVYRPIQIGAVTGGANDALYAAYHAVNPNIAIGGAIGPGLDHISSCEYWTLAHSGAPFQSNVTLHWRDPQSCGVTLLPDMRVANHVVATTTWLDRGNGGTTGNVLAGTVATSAVHLHNATTTPYWTLASVSSENPLPIELIYFGVRNDAGGVTLQWTTATEIDNDHFTVERSADGQAFSAIAVVPGAGTSLSVLHYSEPDPSPLMGTSYYRLRQTDHDGTTTLSPVVSIRRDGAAVPGVHLFVQDDRLIVDHALPAGTNYTLLDMTGRIVGEGRTVDEERSSFAIGHLPHGAYLLRLQHGERLEIGRFVR